MPLGLKALTRYPYAHFSVSPRGAFATPGETPGPHSGNAPIPKDKCFTGLPPEAEFVCHFQPRWVPRWATQWDVLKDQITRPNPLETCTIFYAFPKRTPGFLSVGYLLCGPETKYRTLRAAVDLVEGIARGQGSQAIVCQAFSERLTERLMNRWGYVRHALSLGPNHYIRRLG